MVPGQVAQGCGAVLFLGVALQHGALLLHPWEQAAPEHWWLGPHPGWEPPLWAFCTLMLGWALTGIFPHVPCALAPAAPQQSPRWGSFGAGAARGRGCRRVPARSAPSLHENQCGSAACSPRAAPGSPQEHPGFLPIDQETPQLLGAAAATGSCAGRAMPTRLRRMRPRGAFAVPTPPRSWVAEIAQPHRLLLPYLAQPPQHWSGERAGHQQRPSPCFGRIFL